MYFLFFICEVKCDAAELDVVNWQNANNMTFIIRDVVKLFRLVHCESQLYWKFLAFLILHNDEVVRIFNHYSIIDEDKMTFYCHSIKKFDFTSEEGKDKWTVYRFTKNIYNVWILNHHKLICSAIEKISKDVNFSASLDDLFTSIASVNNELKLSDLQKIMISAPSSQDNVSFKKPKLSSKIMLQKENNWQKEQINELKNQFNEQVNLLKLQHSSNVSSANKPMLKQEVNRLTEQNKKLTDWLKQKRKQSKQKFNQLQQKRKQSKQINDQLKKVIDLFKTLLLCNHID